MLQVEDVWESEESVSESSGSDSETSSTAGSELQPPTVILQKPRKHPAPEKAPTKTDPAETELGVSSKGRVRKRRIIPDNSEDQGLHIPKKKKPAEEKKDLPNILQRSTKPEAATGSTESQVQAALSAVQFQQLQNALQSGGVSLISHNGQTLLVRGLSSVPGANSPSLKNATLLAYLTSGKGAPGTAATQPAAAATTTTAAATVLKSAGKEVQPTPDSSMRTLLLSETPKQQSPVKAMGTVQARRQVVTSGGKTTTLQAPTPNTAQPSLQTTPSKAGVTKARPQTTPEKAGDTHTQQTLGSTPSKVGAKLQCASLNVASQLPANMVQQLLRTQDVRLKLLSEKGTTASALMPSTTVAGSELTNTPGLVRSILSSTQQFGKPAIATLPEGHVINTQKSQQHFSAELMAKLTASAQENAGLPASVTQLGMLSPQKPKYAGNITVKALLESHSVGSTVTPVVAPSALIQARSLEKQLNSKTGALLQTSGQTITSERPPVTIQQQAAVGRLMSSPVKVTMAASPAKSAVTAGRVQLLATQGPSSLVSRAVTGGAEAAPVITVTNCAAAGHAPTALRTTVPHVVQLPLGGVAAAQPSGVKQVIVASPAQLQALLAAKQKSAAIDKAVKTIITDVSTTLPTAHIKVSSPQLVPSRQRHRPLTIPTAAMKAPIPALPDIVGKEQEEEGPSSLQHVMPQTPAATASGLAAADAITCAVTAMGLQMAAAVQPSATATAVLSPTPVSAQQLVLHSMHGTVAGGATQLKQIVTSPAKDLVAQKAAQPHRMLTFQPNTSALQQGLAVQPAVAPQHTLAVQPAVAPQNTVTVQPAVAPQQTVAVVVKQGAVNQGVMPQPVVQPGIVQGVTQLGVVQPDVQQGIVQQPVVQGVVLPQGLAVPRAVVVSPSAAAPKGSGVTPISWAPDELSSETSRGLVCPAESGWHISTCTGPAGYSAGSYTRSGTPCCH